MASRNVSFGAWMLDLVSGVDKLENLAHSTHYDLECWELGLFKVLGAQGILHHVKGNTTSDISSSEASRAEKALALALLILTVDESVKERLTQPLDNPGLVYHEISERFMEFVDANRNKQSHRTQWLARLREDITAKKTTLDITIKEKEQELSKLRDEMNILEEGIEWTHDPDGNTLCW